MEPAPQVGHRFVGTGSALPRLGSAGRHRHVDFQLLRRTRLSLALTFWTLLYHPMLRGGGTASRNWLFCMNVGAGVGPSEENHAFCGHRRLHALTRHRSTGNRRCALPVRHGVDVQARTFS